MDGFPSGMKPELLALTQIASQMPRDASHLGDGKLDEDDDDEDMKTEEL